MAVKLFIFCVLYLAANCAAISFIEPCKRDDNECVLKSARKALPHIADGDKSLGLEPSDPLVMEHVVADVGELKLRFNKLTIKGVKNCDIQKCQRDLAKSYVTLEMVCPIQVTGLYEAKGKLLVVPVEGNGDFHLKSDKIKIVAQGKIKEVTRNGGKYWEISGRRVDLEPITVEEIVFNNLYNGDKEKAAPVESIINSSKIELMTTYGKPILEQLFKDVLQKLQKAIVDVPVSELELA